MTNHFSNFKINQIFTVKYEAIKLLDEYKYYMKKKGENIDKFDYTNNSNKLSWNH